MNEIKSAAYFQFGTGALAIVVGLLSGGGMLPFLLIGLGMLAGGFLTMRSPS